MNEQIKFQAQIIASRLNDIQAIWFHYKAVKQLGFQQCYELSSISLLAKHQGKIRTTPARYYNGCVKEELQGK